MSVPVGMNRQIGLELFLLHPHNLSLIHNATKTRTSGVIDTTKHRANRLLGSRFLGMIKRLSHIDEYPLKMVFMGLIIVLIGADRPLSLTKYWKILSRYLVKSQSNT